MRNKAHTKPGSSLIGFPIAGHHFPNVTGKIQVTRQRISMCITSMNTYYALVKHLFQHNAVLSGVFLKKMMLQ